ncbi:MAG: hypothetical protein ABW141_12770, partial [Candidatus Thiodiazotropha endolucinida]
KTSVQVVLYVGQNSMQIIGLGGSILGAIQHYVSSDLAPAAAYAHIDQVMDANDRLAVINAESGVVSNWDNPPIDAINAIWHKPKLE